jgi:hypothetical protein
MHNYIYLSICCSIHTSIYLLTFTHVRPSGHLHNYVAACQSVSLCVRPSMSIQPSVLFGLCGSPFAFKFLLDLRGSRWGIMYFCAMTPCSSVDTNV